MAQPASKHAAIVPASSTTPQASGTDLILGVLESALVGGDVSAQTNQFLHTQADQPPSVQGAPVVVNPTDTVNRLAALVMGSPEFQMR